MAAPDYTLDLTDIIVPGPVQVMASVNGTDWASFGMADNDNMPQWSARDVIHEIRTSASGASPEQLVHQGTVATLALTLVQYDTTLLGQIQALMRGGSATTTVVGTVLAGDTAANSKTFGLRLVPLITSTATVPRPGVSFPRCYVNGEWTESRYGNVEKALSFTALVMPSPTDGSLYSILPNT